MYDELKRAARNTMQASAEVTLDLFYEFEAEEPGRGQMAGKVDFEAGRCQLSGDGEQYILDGSDDYQMREGEWVVLRGRPGTQSTLNPAWLLTRLTDAVVSSDRVGEEIVGTLDRERVDSTSIGLAPEWTPGYRATLKAGRIVGMAFECVGDDGRVGTSTTFALTTATVAPISLPEHATLIANDTQTTEDEMELEWRDSGLWRMVERDRGRSRHPAVAGVCVDANPADGPSRPGRRRFWPNHPTTASARPRDPGRTAQRRRLVTARRRR